jgi:hypothetical protein
LQRKDGMLHYDKDKLLEIGMKNEQAEIDCLRKFIHIPTCYYKKQDLKPIITQLTEEFKKRGYKVQTFSTAGAPVVVADLDLGMKKNSIVLQSL